MARDGQGEEQRTSDAKRGGQRGISEHDAQDVEELSAPRTPAIYEVVRRLGEKERWRVSSLC